MLGFGSLGWGEIVIIMIALLLLFGARRLPEIGQSLGKGIREFKNSLTSSSDEEQKLSSGDQSEVETQRKREEAS